MRKKKKVCQPKDKFEYLSRSELEEKSLTDLEIIKRNTQELYNKKGRKFYLSYLKDIESVIESRENNDDDDDDDDPDEPEPDIGKQSGFEFLQSSDEEDEPSKTKKKKKKRMKKKRFSIESSSSSSSESSSSDEDDEDDEIDEIDEIFFPQKKIKQDVKIKPPFIPFLKSIDDDEMIIDGDDEEIEDEGEESETDDETDDEDDGSVKIADSELLFALSEENEKKKEVEKRKKLERRQRKLAKRMEKKQFKQTKIPQYQRPDIISPQKESQNEFEFPTTQINAPFVPAQSLHQSISPSPDQFSYNQQQQMSLDAQEMNKQNSGFVDQSLTSINLPAYHEEMFGNGKSQGGDNGLAEKDVESMYGTGKIEYLKMLETPRQMTIVLHPHQQCALHWMVEAEKRQKGGILADEMGLGKTVEMIALMAQTCEKVRGLTLIVAPLSLLYQWEEEIRSKLNQYRLRLKCLIYHGSERKNKTPAMLRNYRVVITTYGVVGGQFPFKIKNGKRKGQIWPKEKGLLFKVHFDRIILDEAHLIRNRGTRASSACVALDGKYRWCLTGTPIFNKEEDLYTLFQFIQYSPYHIVEIFNREIRDRVRGNSKIGLSKLQEILAKVLLRRNKSQMLFGKKIIELPEKEDKMIYVEFNDEEREFYDALMKKSQAKFNKYCNEGTVMKNYMNILVLLLRLRQACDHPYLVINMAYDNFEDSDDENDEDGDKKMKDKKKKKKKKIQEAKSCPICLDVIEDRVWTRCAEKPTPQHFFCRECLHRHMTENIPNCPMCRRHLSFKIFPEREVNTSKRFRHSSKTKILLEYIKKDLHNTNDKIIIISQWTSFLDLLEHPIKKLLAEKKFGENNQRFRYDKLDGRMNLDERYRVMSTCKKSMRCRILLVSMKACGLGLNLTFCNRLYFMDHWWNSAAENQSIDRVYRIGQKKKTYIFRFAIKKSVEETIMKIKKRKQDIANSVLGEKKRLFGSTLIADLCMLFDLE